MDKKSFRDMESALQEVIYEDAAEALFNLVPHIMKSVGCGVSKKETGLTFNQIRALNFLAPQKRHLGEIAEDRGVSPASASALIDTLESGGYVIRETDTIDNRKVLIGLTAKGRETFNQLSERTQKNLLQIVSVLNAEDIDHLARILHILNRKR